MTEVIENKGIENSTEEEFYEAIETEPVPDKHYEYGSDSADSYHFPPKTGHELKPFSPNIK
jgi:hypothetical protein